MIRIWLLSVAALPSVAVIAAHGATVQPSATLATIIRQDEPRCSVSFNLEAVRATLRVK